MNEFVFEITITPERWAEFYRSPNTTVIARSYDGRRVQFAARHLQRHVTRDGVRGVFRMVIDGDRNFVRLDRVS